MKKRGIKHKIYENLINIGTHRRFMIENQE